jgi:hypothetical protein
MSWPYLLRSGPFSGGSSPYLCLPRGATISGWVATASRAEGRSSRSAARRRPRRHDRSTTHMSHCHGVPLAPRPQTPLMSCYRIRSHRWARSCGVDRYHTSGRASPAGSLAAVGELQRAGVHDRAVGELILIAHGHREVCPTRRALQSDLMHDSLQSVSLGGRDASRRFIRVWVGRRCSCLRAFAGQFLHALH